MSMSFDELELCLIEEGEFIEEANAELLKMAKALLKHVYKYGERADGAKAVMTMKIELKQAKDMANAFTLKTSVDTKQPGRPDRVTLALESENQTGERTLFMQPSGTNSDNPRQRRLATENGQTIDPTTGKVKQDDEE